ncbi:MAG: isoprenylcysteine carboxylmethyltransferase family protein [Arenicellales bacterium]
MNIKTRLEHKIPPPVYGLFTGLLIWMLNKWLPSLEIIPSNIQTLGWFILAFGVSIDIISLAQFHQNKTTLNPLKPDNASTIVATGMYRFSRNPMYLGMLIALIGWAVQMGNIAGFACLPLFVWIITQMQILPEERILKEKFGASYVDYLKRVRRWI